MVSSFEMVLMISSFEWSVSDSIKIFLLQIKGSREPLKRVFSETLQKSRVFNKPLF